MNKERNNTNNTNITALDTKSTGSNVNDDANSLKRKISTVSTEAKIPGNQLQQSTPEKYAKIARISHIPLGINKELSVLHDLQLIEYLPVERIRALLKSGQLREKWQNPSYNQEYATKNYKNEVDQIKTYLSKYDRHLKGFKCKYKKPKHGWGRVIPIKSLGLTAFSKATRNTLIEGLYYDFDLENAQPCIIQNICKSNGISCPNIDKYCARTIL